MAEEPKLAKRRRGGRTSPEIRKYNGPAPGGMFLRALFDLDSDETTSLSFRQGDVVRVNTQLESGWWDGTLNGTRG